MVSQNSASKWAILGILTSMLGCGNSGNTADAVMGGLDAAASMDAPVPMDTVRVGADVREDGRAVDSLRPDTALPDTPLDGAAESRDGLAGGDTVRADGRVPDMALDIQTMADSGAVDAGIENDVGDVGSKVVGKPNCVGIPAECGPSKNENCCLATTVPGGSFNRSNDPAAPATVSAFALDTFEVTVARFRVFVDGGLGTQGNPPAAGAGAHPLIVGTGWDPSWNANLVASTAMLRSALGTPTFHTFTETVGGNETRPMNYVTWFEAFAFCAWDGGRLATEAEWNYAAAGGSDQRLYPWGTTAPSSNLASYGCMNSACSFWNITPVGSKSDGKGKWGQSDLAGNVSEWTFDWIATTVYLTPCNDCAETRIGAYRIKRGGDYYIDNFGITTSYRDYDTPTARLVDTGFRCARAKI